MEDFDNACKLQQGFDTVLLHCTIPLTKSLYVAESVKTALTHPISYTYSMDNITPPVYNNIASNPKFAV